jgi:NAD(P)-dependent dehydrogenase (short-subunit alcohol dehydrogenase family)
MAEVGRTQGFRDEVAVVTGAGSGIGRALCLDLARAGARVVASDVVGSGAEDTAARCRELGGWAKAAQLDVADHDAVTAHAREVEDEHGRVDLVINNAGTALAAAVAEQTLDDVFHVLDVNLRGVIHGTQAFLPALERAPAGRLVNISSLFGLVPMPMNSAYAASKYAVRGYTEALAIELDIAGSSVGVTCVHPGGVATGIVDNARTAPGREELAQGFKQALRMPPERAARIILRAVARRQRRVLVGADAWALHLTQLALGHRFQRMVAAGARRRLPEAGAAPGRG